MDYLTPEARAKVERIEAALDDANSVRRCPCCAGDITDQIDTAYEAGFQRALEKRNALSALPAGRAEDFRPAHGEAPGMFP